MNNNLNEQIALFRYGIIAPLVSGTDNCKSKNEYFNLHGNKEYRFIDGSSVHVSPGSIERWYYNYQKHGFDGLKMKPRTDVGTTRKLDNELINTITFYVDNHPRLPATAIRTDLIKNGFITESDVSLSTITRFVQAYKKGKDITSKTEMRRYECKHINDVWCCDTSYSFKLTDNGEKKRTFIIAIIDDASRLVVGCDVFFNDNYVNYMTVLKSAIEHYGLPKVLNLDNGTPYKNGQIDLLAARLGIRLNHCAPYTPEGKAKIERWFRTMKDHFMAGYTVKASTTIESYRKDLLDYVKEYNNFPHSSLKGKSPNERYFNGEDQIRRCTQEIIDTSFLLEEERRVTIDNVIVLDRKEFEVPYKYSNRKIKIRYSPDFKVVYVVEANNELTPITLLDKVANSTVKRNKPKFNTNGDDTK